MASASGATGDFRREAEREGRNVPFHLEVDTGMGRAGLSWALAEQWIAEVRAIEADAKGALYENKAGTRGLGTAGSGDVLAGIIGGLLAQITTQKTDAIRAAVAAVPNVTGTSLTFGALSDAERITLVHAVYDELPDVLADLGMVNVAGVLFDLGVSSMQLDVRERGFAYAEDAPLDMRMGSTGPTAADVLNTYSATELTRVLRDYGEEKFARKIAGAVGTIAMDAIWYQRYRGIGSPNRSRVPERY